jgi:serine/threonine protein kinase
MTTDAATSCQIGGQFQGSFGNPPLFSRFKNICLLKKLEEGGSKDVFFARSLGKKQKNYIFCSYKPSFRLEQIEKEIKMLRFLKLDKNLNISLPVEIFYDKINAFLIYPFLTKKTLFDCISSDKYKISKIECLIIERQLAEGIKHLHKLGVVHRDIKPENVLWIKGQEKAISFVQLTDFGSATHLTEIKHVFTGMTADYVSPQLLVCDKKTPQDFLNNVFLINDIWAFGVLCLGLEKKTLFPAFAYGFFVFNQIKKINEIKRSRKETNGEELELERIKSIVKKNMEKGWDWELLKTEVDRRLKEIDENKRVLLAGEKERLKEIKNIIDITKTDKGHQEFLETASKFIKEILNLKSDKDQNFLDRAIYEINDSLAGLNVTTV